MPVLYEPYVLFFFFLLWDHHDYIDLQLSLNIFQILIRRNGNCVERQDERKSLKLRCPRVHAVMEVWTVVQMTGPRLHAGVAAKWWCRRRRRAIIREKEGKYYMGLGYTPALCRRVWISFQPARAQHQAPAADTLLHRHKTPVSVCLRVLRGPLARLHPSDRPDPFSQTVFLPCFSQPRLIRTTRSQAGPKHLPQFSSSHFYTYGKRM